jgi:hypothetical protein
MRGGWECGVADRAKMVVVLDVGWLGDRLDADVVSR